MIDLLGRPCESVSGKAKNIAAAFVIKLIWVIFIIAFVGAVTKSDLLMSNEPSFFMSCVWAPVWEEAVFRWAPITISRRLSRYFKEDLVWPVIIISSTIFGWGHGEGPYSLLIQGVGGVILSFLYIKNNYSVFSTMVLHAMWNTFVLYVI